MFDVGWSELLVIAVVALIAIGPKELPGVLRMVGQWTGKIRRMASEFQGQFQEAMREAEMADLQEQVKDAGRALNAQFDPLTMGETKPASDASASPKTDETAAPTETPARDEKAHSAPPADTGRA
jgi:sec-independent protein translocase protein TatB